MPPGSCPRAQRERERESERERERDGEMKRDIEHLTLERQEAVLQFEDCVEKFSAHRRSLGQEMARTRAELLLA